LTRASSAVGVTTSPDLAAQTIANPETMRCPHGYFAAMRRDAPVHRDPVTGMYFISRYSDILDIARQPQLFSSAQGFEEQLRADFTPEVERIMVEEGLGPLPLAVWDPPEHTRIRALMDKAFTPKRVDAMEADVVTIVSALLDRMLPTGSADVVQDYAIPIPMYVIADQLGIDRADRDRFKRWSDAAVEPISGRINRERALECAREMVAFQHYIAPIMADRRAHPQEDMISDLVHAKLDDGSAALDQTELFSIVRGLLVAGNETTTNGISNAIRILAAQPDVANELRAEIDRDRPFVNFVEEVLRLESPVPMLFRMTTADTEVAGVPIPKGSHVVLAWTSANRDETKFECPASFDLKRKNAGHHLAFGVGIHRCIGQVLARMEIKVAVRELLRRTTALALVEPEAPLDYPVSMVVHGPVRLPIRFTCKA
jgi:cytochrome P450